MVPDFNCDMLWRRHHFCLSSQIKVVSTNKMRWVSIESCNFK
nr:MAG TPA: hypothetical protein [Caudoviricetes sp.]